MADFTQPRSDLLSDDVVYHRTRREYGRYRGADQEDPSGLSAWVAFESDPESAVVVSAGLLSPCCPHLISMSDGCLKCERIGYRSRLR
ncbi:hypothetical protein ACQP2Y_21060 [Actinoplanes sp. CA-051413]|uniref:hypothetical protein n=1 Tax=Actinoplanes sp. CA-051413 TaxID=3239899 RepID=UPI003D9747F3